MLPSGNLEILNIYKHKHSGIFALSLSFSKIHFLFLLLWPFKNLSSLLWNFILFCHPFQRVAYFYICFSSVQSLSRVQLCDPMNCSMTGLPVHHQLPEFTQIHVHWVGDAVQPSDPLSSPSPPAFNLCQHQGLFQKVSSSHEVAKVKPWTDLL